MPSLDHGAGLSELEDTALSEPLFPQSCPQDQLSIDQALQAWVGEFGCAQMRHSLLVSLAWCLHCLLTFSMVFSDKSPSWVCTGGSSLINKLSSGPGYIHHNTMLSSCDGANSSSIRSSLCNSTSSICTMDASLWAWAGGKGVSTVSQWGLICSQSYKVGLVQSLFFAGSMVGAGVCGNLSDSFLGRKGALFIACSLGSVLSLLTAFAPNYWIYLALRMATGFCVAGIGPAAFLLATEMIGPSKRGPASMFIFFLFSLTIIALCIIARFMSSWRYLYIVNAVPCFLYCLLVLPFVFESPRWCLAQGNADAALAILKQIALENGKTVPSSITLDTERTDVEDVANGESMNLQHKATAIHIFRVSTTRKRMMIMLFVWLSNGLCYYGINLNVPNVGGSISLGLIVNAMGEMPAYVISALLLQRCGRRPLQVCALLLTGVGCLVAALARTSRVRIVCGVVGMFGVAASYNLVYIYTAELFPSEVRNVALGLAVQAAQVGAIASPLAAVLASIRGWLPFSIFSTVALLSSCLALWLPETLGKPMHETMHGLLRYKMEQSSNA